MDDMAAIQAAVRHARLTGGGIIHFDGDKIYRAIGQQELIREFILDLNGAKNISIQGNGATVLLHSPDDLFNTSYAENIQVDGFGVDYLPKPYYQRFISDISVQNRTIDISDPNRYPIPQVGIAPTHGPFFGRSFIPDAPGVRSGSGDNVYIESKTIRGNNRELRLHVTELANGAPMEPRLRNARDNEATEFVVSHIVYGYLDGHARILNSSRAALTNINQVRAPFFGYISNILKGPVFGRRTGRFYAAWHV